ncbi:MAG TPA: hypothetical protein PK252_11025 [Bacteroidales bacterium]|nr:hypothetical protein [Bacteroidales bacterium]
MKTLKFISVAIFMLFFASCGKYSSSEKEVIKQKIIAMYNQVPKMTMQNAAGYDFNSSNAICREVVQKDSVLTGFFNYIFTDQKSETGVPLSIEYANFASIPVQFLVKDALELTKEEFDSIRVARVIF